MLLCVDPGLLTGVAALERIDDNVKLLGSAERNEDQFANWFRTMLDEGVNEEQHHGQVLSIVCEQFFITAQTAKNSQAPWSLENIGIMKQCLRDIGYPLERVFWQKPSAAKLVVPNDKLHRLELWHRGGAGHANDAIRHGVLCLIKRGWVDTRMLRADA